MRKLLRPVRAFMVLTGFVGLVTLTYGFRVSG